MPSFCWWSSNTKNGTDVPRHCRKTTCVPPDFLCGPICRKEEEEEKEKKTPPRALARSPPRPFLPHCSPTSLGILPLSRAVPLLRAPCLGHTYADVQTRADNEKTQTRRRGRRPSLDCEEKAPRCVGLYTKKRFALSETGYEWEK